MAKTGMPLIGNVVETADGEKLGTVSEVRGDYFKVRAPAAPDYWLPAWDVTAREIGMVRLIFTTPFLDEHKCDAHLI